MEEGDEGREMWSDEMFFSVLKVVEKVCYNTHPSRWKNNVNKSVKQRC